MRTSRKNLHEKSNANSTTNVLVPKPVKPKIETRDNTLPAGSDISKDLMKQASEITDPYKNISSAMYGEAQPPSLTATPIQAKRSIVTQETEI